MGEQFNFGTLADKALVEEVSFDDRRPHDTIYQTMIGKFDVFDRGVKRQHIRFCAEQRRRRC